MDSPIISRRWSALPLGLILAGLAFLAGPDAVPASSTQPWPAFEREIREIDALHEDGRYPEAYERSVELLGRVEKLAGPDSLAMAEVLDHVALEQTSCARPPLELAEARARQALRIKERLLEEGDPRVADTLLVLGKVLQMRLDQAESVKALRRAAAIWTLTRGPESPEVAEALAWSGKARRLMDDNAGAEEELKRSLSIQEKTRIGDRSMAVLELARVSLAVGRYEEAREQALESLKLRERILRPDHPSIALSLTVLALALAGTGDLAAGIEADRKALQIREPLALEYSDVGSSQANLALKLLELGDYEEAYKLTEIAWRNGLARNGPDHPSAGHGPNNLGEILLGAGKYEEASRMLEEAIRIKERVNGPEHHKLIASLSALVKVRMATDSYDEAERLLRRAAAIAEKWYGRDHPQNALLLNQLASLEERRGNLNRARELATQALELQRAQLGADHPDAAVSLVTMAQVALEQERWTEALQCSLEAEALMRRHLQRVSQGLSEREALHYEAIRALGSDIAIAAVLRDPSKQGSPDAVAQVWDATIRSRALVLDEVASRHRLALDAKDERSRELVDRLEQSRSRLARLALRAPASSEELKRAREDEEAAERALAQASAGFRVLQRREAIGLPEVRRMLPPRWALVAFVQYRERWNAGADGLAGGSAPEREAYAAFALSDDGKGARAVPLGPVAEIDLLVRRWRSVAGTEPTDAKSEADLDGIGRALRRAIWDPVMRRLPSVESVMVVPAGAINLVNVAALPTDEGAYLLEGGPRIHYLSAERDVVRSEESTPGKGMLALGGADFDAGDASGALRPSLVASLTRGPRSGCDDARSMRFGSLPGTQAEVEEVTSLWKGAKRGGRTEALMGRAADEEAFKRKAPGKRILHLATHGFFLDDRCASSLRSTRSGSGRAASFLEDATVGENPLLLSGLAMAGANLRNDPAAPSQNQDGLLTAMEVASLDLRGVEWAVLSACQTGVGPVLAGEGVVGLRRAFQIAGAGSIIMSLWEVKDLPAREWIKRLYRARLSGLTTVESVHRASLDILEARRKAGVSTHPFYWGAFIASGDWR